jgi:hypothetical protein
MKIIIIRLKSGLYRGNLETQEGIWTGGNSIKEVLGTIVQNNADLLGLEIEVKPET